MTYALPNLSNRDLMELLRRARACWAAQEFVQSQGLDARDTWAVADPLWKVWILEKIAIHPGWFPHEDLRGLRGDLLDLLKTRDAQTFEQTESFRRINGDIWEWYTREMKQRINDPRPEPWEQFLKEYRRRMDDTAREHREASIKIQQAFYMGVSALVTFREGPYVLGF